ncbi:hypothetical protein FHS51_000777 [Sphingobium wenxiniae]|uniref:Uncharacterized protein n=1 Tax=Sphingobium wenxiniae (strain DSM 21828 / CGMCC 1.7748 / JZ-1) TaxID=595605 RepID=A0A562KIP4_SPHWJ|nr:hypothetical protein [Sphingobium wenxiniae]MBB6190564.1 hypothetical protein [Sphingobium wenxiniae]TWH95278.1 hypothetical protein IQ35_01534 [Sphingobium wenxiniae]
MNGTDIATKEGAVAPTFIRPDTIDATALLACIERHLHHTGTYATVFGQRAVNDPRFVHDLRKGRRVTRRTASRVESYLAKGA